MVLMKDESGWSVIWFFDSEEAATAAEKRFEELGDEIPKAFAASASASKVSKSPSM